MANELALFAGNQPRPSHAMVPVGPSALTDSLAGRDLGFGKRISIKGGVFRLIVDGKQVAALDERYLDVVIIRGAPHIGRTYYAQGFDEEKPSAPDCWSADGVKPDASVAAPQCDTCMDCPQNAKGSGNEESRACRFSQRVAVLLANDIEGGDIMQLSLPAQSLFGKEEGDNRPLQAYARFLKGNKAAVEQFITRLKFDTNVSNPKLFFKAMRWLDDEEYAIAKEKGASEEAERAVVMTVAQQDKVAGGLPPKKAVVVQDEPPPPQPKAAAKVKPAEDEEPPPPPSKSSRKSKGTPTATAAPAAEPTVRASAATAPAAPERADISKIAADWGADD